MDKFEHYIILRELFRYPDANWIENVIKCQNLLNTIYPEAAGVLSDFTEIIKTKDLAELQESYVNTFEIKPVCFLETGYTLFGEDYKRTQLLAGLNEEYSNAGVQCTEELADHIVNILMLISRINNEDVLNDLIHEITLPALDKMLKCFDESENIYRFPLEVIRLILKKDFSNNKISI